MPGQFALNVYEQSIMAHELQKKITAKSIVAISDINEYLKENKINGSANMIHDMIIVDYKVTIDGRSPEDFIESTLSNLSKSLKDEEFK